MSSTGENRSGCDLFLKAAFDCIIVLSIIRSQLVFMWYPLLCLCSALQIDQKELKKEMEKQDEQNESLMKQMEGLNSENGELQQQVVAMEKKTSEMSANLSSVEDERNLLRDSLQETSQLCLEMESKVSSYKQEKEGVLDEYKDGGTRKEAHSGGGRRGLDGTCNHGKREGCFGYDTDAIDSWRPASTHC